MEASVSSLKSKIIDALSAEDFDKVADMAATDRRTFGKLVALASNKEDILCWRAIEAMGAGAAAVSSTNPARVRNVVQRILWSAREESGGMGWSAPELLAVIASARPKQFADLPPIIVSLHTEDEEKVFLKGVLWAIARMAEVGIVDVSGAEEVVRTGLKDSEPAVRGLAVTAALKAEIDIGLPELKKLSKDESHFQVYENGRFVNKTVGETARAVLAGRA